MTTQNSEAPREAKHTKEPWYCKRENDGLIAFRVSSNGMIIADFLFRHDIQYAVEREEAEANADRAVACVNALADLNPAAVRDAVKMLRIICEGANTVGNHVTVNREAINAGLEVIRRLRETGHAKPKGHP